MAAKSWRGKLRRECLCGEPYEVLYEHARGKPPSVSVLGPPQCGRCGRYKRDPVRRRGWGFDGRYERS